MLVVLMLVMVSIIVITVTPVFTSWLVSPPMRPSIDRVPLTFYILQPIQQYQKSPTEGHASKKTTTRQIYIQTGRNTHFSH